MKREDLIPYLETKVNDLDIFKTILTYQAPPANTIKNFPALAITYNETKFIDGSVTCRRVNQDVYLNFVFYNKRVKQGQHIDIISTYVEDIISMFKTILPSSDMIDIELVKLKDDEGLIHPYQVAILLVKFKI